MKEKTLANIRRQYGQLALSEDKIDADPFSQFRSWFAEVLNLDYADPTAMVLSTIDESNCPDSRVVLLKGLENSSFIFFTSYDSVKAKQLEKNSAAALNFYWPELARQVRVKGFIKKISADLSDEYFSLRPKESQLAALISQQSSELPSRLALEEKFSKAEEQYKDSAVKRPKNWGGYGLLPTQIEFWQGRDNRLHDRIQYYQQENIWKYRRLAP